MKFKKAKSVFLSCIMSVFIIAVAVPFYASADAVADMDSLIKKNSYDCAVLVHT